MEVRARETSLFRFGAFELDARAGELRKNGARLRLSGQPFAVLQLLLERAGEIVAREELRHRLWPADTFVDFDHSVNNAVARIREALGDSAEAPRFVATVPRRGYRFLAQVETVLVDGARPATTRAIIGRAERSFGLLLAVAGVLITAIAIIAGWRIIRGEHGPYRIAVLPLNNLSSEPGSDYFSDGLTDEIIHDLSLIDGLEVTSRTSSFAFKGRPRNIREVGQQLGVDLVLEGSVLRDGPRLRISTDLVRVADDRTTWSAQYDRKVGDVLAIQNEISRSIVNELRLSNIGGQRRYEADVETYDLYMRAQALTHQATPGNDPRRERAADLFQQVVDRQPDFAPAYAALADAYASLRNRGGSLEASRKMREAAEMAIQLDPLLPEAYVAVGLSRAADLRWSDAEQAFRRAIAINPSSSRARSDFVIYVLLPEGKLTDALHEIRKAAALDPLSAASQLGVAFVLLRAGRYDEAHAIASRVLAAHPGNGFAIQLNARALLLDGKAQQAVAILQQQMSDSHGYLGYAYATVGRRADAELLAAEDDPAAARHQVLIYAALGDRRRAFEALQKIADMDDPMADLYPGEPELTSLRDDAWMKEFRRRRNLP